MTDSQAINSSVLAEYLDVLKQMQASLKEYTRVDVSTVTIPETTTSKHIAYRIFDRIRTHQILDDLDALRALVAEQEQASAGEAIGRAIDTLDEYANSQVTPQFAVGDTVKVKDGYSFERMDAIVGFEGTVKGIGITIEEIDPFRNDGVIVDIPELPTREQRMYPQDLAKIAKEQA